MCGIAGIYRPGGPPVPRELVARMAAPLRHRGPDGEGVYAQGAIGLGHRRLAVLDLTAEGAQPMADARRELWITYNGEIYNFQELREELRGLGYAFRSRSDTEVILAAYRAWGRECVHRFNGMFAFGLWDSRDQTLWLVRDRLGVKPLFYHDGAQGCLFASEIKGLLPALQGRPQLNEEGLQHFLSLNYMPSPLTLFRGVQQLPPGHWLVRGPEGPATPVAYWTLPTEPRRQVSARQAVAQVAALVEEAVRLRLVSDVEVGAFLSGGVDSSAVVACMRRHLPPTRRLRTFTAGFAEDTYDEAPAARETARHFRTAHEEQTVGVADLALLPQLIWHSEELTADASMLALYRVAERAHQKVKVVLSGDGADELFGGYPTYLATRLAGVYGHLPAFLRRGIVEPLVARLPARRTKLGLEERLRRFVQGASVEPGQAHAAWRAIFNEEEKSRLWPGRPPGPATSTLYARALPPADGDPVNRLLHADLTFYLPNDMLVKLDRMTMAWGLEARTPYLDYRLVEWVATLPSRLKCAQGWANKQLLRRAVRGLLPAAICRRRKAGFNLPHARWFQAQGPALRQALLEEPSSLLRLFARAEIERLVQEHVSGRADRAYQLWALLCLSAWGRQFLDGEACLAISS